MKNLLLYPLIGLCTLLFAFTTTDYAKKVRLSVELKDCNTKDSLFLFQFEGFGFSKVVGASQKTGSFEFKLPRSNAQFYYLGKNTSKLKPIILGTEPDIKVKGTCDNISDAIIGSKLNQEYEKLREQLGQLRIETNRILQDFQKSQNDEGMQKMAIFELSEVDDKRIDLLNKYKEIDPLLGEIAALNTYLSFQNNGSDYYSEIDYFANEFFQFTDFNSPFYNHNPWIFDVFKEYTATLSSINIEKELHQSYLDDALRKIPSDAHAYQLALAGAVMAMDERKHKNYTLYGRQLIQKYEATHGALIASLKKRIEGVGAVESGAVAPDFTQKTPEGEDFSLSDLRGKFVLIDFWASWCGPCRRENPHVKALYDKYSHRGFEIIGVSLDRTKASWERAIAQDGLDWYHVSDLKGWKNEVAKMYSVSSIPHTILLDQEGRIIARKLRSAQLEEVLTQIFGS